MIRSRVKIRSNFGCAAREDFSFSCFVCLMSNDRVRSHSIRIFPATNYDAIVAENFITSNQISWRIRLAKSSNFNFHIRCLFASNFHVKWSGFVSSLDDNACHCFRPSICFITDQKSWASFDNDRQLGNRIGLGLSISSILNYFFVSFHNFRLQFSLLLQFPWNRNYLIELNKSVLFGHSLETRH